MLKSNNMNRSKIILLLLPLLVPVFGSAQISLSIEKPVEGENVTINLTKPQSELLITYRPNSAVVRRDTIKASSPSSVFVWTPEIAGVVKITAGSDSKNVSVHYARLSVRGFFVMIFAGLLLFGGAIFAFKTLFRDEEEDGTMDFDPDLKPDT